MHFPMKFGTLAFICGSILVILVIAYLISPVYLMHWKAYAAVARWFPYSRQAPEALLLGAEQADSTPGMSVVYIFPGNENSATNPVAPNLVQNAKSDLERLINRYPNSSSATEAKWQLALVEEQAGKWDKALADFVAIAHSTSLHAQDAKNQLTHFPSPTSSSKGDIVVTGRVTAGGKPLAHVYVFLRAESEKNIFETDVEEHYPGAYTDMNGVFRIVDTRGGSADKLPDGLYQVGVGVSPAQVTGYFLPIPLDSVVHVVKGQIAHYDVKFVPQVTVNSPKGGTTIHGDHVTFSWNPYPGAASYHVHITDFLGLPDNYSSVTVQLPGSFKTNSTTYTMTELRQYLPGVSYDGVHGLSPSSVLGVLYPGGEFSWSVDALDTSGKLISSSSGYSMGPPDKSSQVPVFYTSSDGESAGDGYVLKYQYDKAKAAYLKEGNNPYSLRSLAVMALYGTQMNGKTDPKLALSYLEKIQHPTPDIQSLITEAKKKLSDEAH